MRAMLLLVTRRRGPLRAKRDRQAPGMKNGVQGERPATNPEPAPEPPDADGEASGAGRLPQPLLDLLDALSDIC